MNSKKIYINSISSLHGKYPNKPVEPDYKEFIPDMNTRRKMSRIVRMAFATAMDCLKKQPDIDINAIITATGLGCLEYSEKFLSSIIINEEKLINPSPFIQSTFNTIGAQIALFLKNNSYNMTHTHRGLSFESALLDAMMQIKETAHCNVLLGAAEEIIESQYIVLQRMGAWRKHTAGEGTQFFLLSDKNEDSYAEIKDLKTIFHLDDVQELGDKIDDFLKQNDLRILDIDTVYSGDANTDGLFCNASTVYFKDICGEYQTATAFALWLACTEMKEKKFKNVIIYNTYGGVNHSLILLQNPN